MTESYRGTVEARNSKSDVDRITSLYYRYLFKDLISALHSALMICVMMRRETFVHGGCVLH